MTGGIGMGKSTAADLLRARGVLVVDSDVIARQVVEPGQPALAEVQQLFGAEIVGADGRLRRDELARRVFGDSEARRRLEAILHPRIRAIWLAQLKSWRSEGHPAAIAVIPLLFETDAARHFDATVCVACSAQTQRRRLRARGWTDEQIDQRLAAQFSVEKKMALADYVVWTEGGLEVHQAQLEQIFGRALQCAGNAAREK
jgi:dephospho-CoA kinase